MKAVLAALGAVGITIGTGFLPPDFDDKAKDVVTVAALCVALGVLYRYVLSPLVRWARRLAQAVHKLADRWDEVADHTEKIGDLVGVLEEHEQRDAERFAAVADWSQNFKDFPPMQMPTYTEGMTQ